MPAQAGPAKSASPVRARVRVRIPPRQVSRGRRFRRPLGPQGRRRPLVELEEALLQRLLPGHRGRGVGLPAGQAHRHGLSGTDVDYLGLCTS